MQAIGEDRALPESDILPPNPWRLRLFAVTASLCIHLALVIAALRYGEIEYSAVSTPSLTIGLVPDNPLLLETEPAALTPGDIPEAVPEAIRTEDAAREGSPEPQLPAEAEPITEALATVEAAPTSAPAGPESIEPLVQAPSISNILSTVSQSRAEQQAELREWANSCTELQRVAGVLGCQQQQESNYQAIEQAPEAQSVYQFHNPPAELTRAQRALPTIASNTGLLATNLAMADIPQGLAEQVMAETEAGISLYSNRGNPALAVMDRMVDQSAAAQIAREMNSPWVQFQRQQLSLRRYANRQDSQTAQSCGSVGLLILKPSELAGCVSRGNIPGLTVPLQIEIEF